VTKIEPWRGSAVDSGLRMGHPWKAGIVVREVHGGSETRLLDDRGVEEAQIVCGYRPCAARIAGFLCSRHDKLHWVIVDGMFEVVWDVALDIDIIRLRERHARQWERQRKLGHPWSKFRPQRRRSKIVNYMNQGRDLEENRGSWPSWPFAFVCPVCGRANVADFPAYCTQDCQFHCQTCARPRRLGQSHSCRPTFEEVLADLLNR